MINILASDYIQESFFLKINHIQLKRTVITCM